MADNLLYLTELVGLKVFDLKGRRTAVWLTPPGALLDPLHRPLPGSAAGRLTIRHEQVRIDLTGRHLPSRRALSPITRPVQCGFPRSADQQIIASMAQGGPVTT